MIKSFQLLTILLLSLTLTGCANVSGSLSDMLGLEPTITPTPVRYPLDARLVSAAASDNITSYRVNLIAEFDGLKQQEIVTGSLESLIEIDRDDATRHYYTKINGPPPLVGGITEVFQTDSRIFLKEPDKATWQMWSVADQAETPPANFPRWENLLLLPESVLTPPQPQTLNEQSVEHYTFTAADLDRPDIVVQKTQGDVWLSVPDKIVRQYAISTTLKYITPPAKAYLFDQGQLQLRYTVSEVNQPLTITPPDVEAIFAGTPFAALPRLPDATINAIFPGLIEYSSAQSPISATIFYRDELLTQDWEETNADIFNEKANMSFSKADDRLSVVIIPRENGGPTQIGLSLPDAP